MILLVLLVPLLVAGVCLQRARVEQRRSRHDDVAHRRLLRELRRH